ncbi:MAG: tyrosine-type recombinase/integrase [Xanthobacteraceae bacterium]|nr:tyrosine-type recombinase/integrase [Xanthobacteraceae bacterium]
MPRIKLTKSAIDALPTKTSEVVYWDSGCPGFGLKVTPKGRKVFLVLYRTGGAGSKLRKYTIGPYGKVTLHHARIAAQKVFTAKLEGRDPAREKREARIREVTDRVADVLEAYIAQHVSGNRSAAEISRLLRREVTSAWGHRSVHDISKRDVVELVSAIDQRGAPAAANKTLKSVKTFFVWCVGRAILDKSPADGVPLPGREQARDRILSDVELTKVLRAARTMSGPYGAIIEFLALTGQRREEVAQATWDEFDFNQRTWTLPQERTKNSKSHVVHLGAASIALLERMPNMSAYVFSLTGKPFRRFSAAKRKLDALSGVTGWRLHDLRRTCVSGMARLGVAPHVADKILNHQSGTISGVAAVYQRHDFSAERKDAIMHWDEHIGHLMAVTTEVVRRVA